MNNHQTDLTPVDIVIVGHGPVGAALGCFLGQYGLRTLIVDKAEGILTMPRAIALDNEALRILQAAGLSDDAFPKHLIGEVRMISPFAGLFAKANTQGAIDGHPKLVTFYQPDLESALRKQHNQFECVQALSSTEFMGFDESADGVAVHLKQGGLSWTVHARYLLGADGASSRVRELIGLDFTGQTYAEDWLIVDVNQRDVHKFRHVEFNCSPDLPSPHMPAPGGRERWEFMLNPTQSREEALQDDYIRQLLQPWVGNEPVSIERKAVYRFHARCSKSFQRGRVFLVGDAAHITPPFVGQGLVAGLRDAFNLSWKLAARLRGVSGEQSLLSYDRERRPHARRMINLAKWMGGMVMPPSRFRAALVHSAMKSVRILPRMRAYFEELEIKPKNQFSQGLFDRHRLAVNRPFRVGGTVPQGRLFSVTQGVVRSDEALGFGFSLIGLGCSLETLLTPSDLMPLRGLTPRLLNIRPQTENPAMDALSDLDGVFAGQSGSPPSVILVRPDRVVMGQASPQHARQMLKRCFYQLAS